MTLFIKSKLPSTYHIPRSVRSFNTRVNQKVMSAISFERIAQLVQKESIIKAQFHKRGHLVLSGPTTDRQLLFDVARLFGNIQGHVRSPEDGIVEIRSTYLQLQDKQVNSNIHFFAHTDGHYLEGLASRKKQTFRVAPPKIIVLQCVKPSAKGGVSFLVDGRAILLNIIKYHPHLLPTLFSRDCMSICREDRLVMDLSVFRKLPSGRFSIRFSYDQDLYVPAWSKKDLVLFNEHYILNPAFARYFSLSEKQILVLDNHRYLHGRTEVKGDRIFRRIWVQDESLSTQMYTMQTEKVPYYGSNESSTQALSLYQHYTAVDDLEGGRFENVQAGIELSQKMQSKIGKLIKN